MKAMQVLKYPVGVQSFESIREGAYLYVDKTKFIYDLVMSGKSYFLSRPRRFGKSLLLSTIETFFKGRRELFDGLYIAGKEWEWNEYPVLHLDLSIQNYRSSSELVQILSNTLDVWEERYDITHDHTLTVSIRFSNLIRKIAEKCGRQVVILVDEYDQPLLKSLTAQELQDELRLELQTFFSVIKAEDRYVRFVMLTGVSKFSKISIFSGLNNLNDISLDARYNNICGITSEELDNYFAEGIIQFAITKKQSVQEIRRQLKEDYDGYHFSVSGDDIYNPFSILNAFDKKSFGEYWFGSGTPTMLVELLKSKAYVLSEISGCRCRESELAGSDVFLDNPIPILYQSGYLTIKDYDDRFGEYILDYPNREVREGFVNFLAPFYLPQKNFSGFSISKLVRAVEQGDADAFMEIIQSFFADFPYDRLGNLEVHYQNVMYIIMKLMGFYIRTEYKTSRGRIDLLIKTSEYIYVIELKLHGTAEDAIHQIEEKGYCKPFKSDKREIICIGAAFDEQTHELSNYIIA